MLSYSLFLGDLSDVFDRVRPALAALSRGMNGLVTLQVVLLLATAAFLASAIAFGASASAGRCRFFKFVPLGCMLIPPLSLLFLGKCAFGPASGDACGESSMWRLGVYLGFLLSLLVLAVAVPRSGVSVRVLRIALAPLSLVALSMGLQLVDLLAWGLTAWPTSQRTVTQIALAHHVQLWLGDWHLSAAAGLVLVAAFGGLALRAIWRGLPALLSENTRRA